MSVDVGREIGRITYGLGKQHVIGLHATARQITAGTLSRTLAQASIHPIDTIKTRIQLHLSALNQGASLTSSIRDLYMGFSIATLGMLPTGFLYFSGYELTSRELKARLRDPETLEMPAGSAQLIHIVSAALGASLSCLSRVPSDVVKHKVQAYIYPDTGTAIRDIYSKQGVKGFYRGLLATMCRDVPELIIQFTTYETLRKIVRRSNNNEPTSPLQSLAIGACAGAVAAFATAPLDMLKTALQVGNSAGPRKGAIEILREIYLHQGVRGLFAGAAPRVMMTATMSGIFFFSFEFIKSLLPEEPDMDLANPLVVNLRPSPAALKVDHLEESKPYSDPSDQSLIGPSYDLFDRDEFLGENSFLPHSVSVAPSYDELLMRNSSSVSVPSQPVVMLGDTDDSTSSLSSSGAASASTREMGSGSPQSSALHRQASFGTTKPVVSGTLPIRSSPGTALQFGTAPTLPDLAPLPPVATTASSLSTSSYNTAPSTTAKFGSKPPLATRPTTDSAFSSNPSAAPPSSASTSGPGMSSKLAQAVNAPVFVPSSSSSLNNASPSSTALNNGTSAATTSRSSFPAPRIDIPHALQHTQSLPSTPMSAPVSTADNPRNLASHLNHSYTNHGHHGHGHHHRRELTPDLPPQPKSTSAASQLQTTSFRRPPLKRQSSQTTVVTCGFSMLIDDSDDGN